MCPADAFHRTVYPPPWRTLLRFPDSQNSKSGAIPQAAPSPRLRSVEQLKMPSEKIPTTSAWRSISLFSRSRLFLLTINRRCSVGKLMKVRTFSSVHPSSPRTFRVRFRYLRRYATQSSLRAVFSGSIRRCNVHFSKPPVLCATLWEIAHYQ